MTVRKIPFVVGEYYHIYNRGVDKRTIFVDECDYKRFITLLYLCNGINPFKMSTLYTHLGPPSAEKIFSVDRGEQFIDIGVYCLMPNHFHILVKGRTEGGISMFMEKLATAYVMYFNTRNERKGALFEGKFKAKHIDNDAYLNWVFSYIHLNPVKLIDKNWKEDGISDPVSAKNFVQNYKYSSYYDYFINDRSESAILNKGAFPEHFLQLNDFEEMIKEFENFDKEI